VTISRAEKRRQLAADLAIGLGLPIILLILRKSLVSITEQPLKFILEYIYQEFRYIILEDVGCLNSTYGSWVEVILCPIPVLLFAIISFTYSILTFYAFRKIRAQSKDIFSSHSNLTNSRYIRIMLLAATNAVCSAVLQLISLVQQFSKKLEPWTSFKELHAHISVVPKYTAEQWRPGSDAFYIDLSRWLWVICALLFFAFFGFSDEAMKYYRYAMSLAGSYVGISSESFGSHSSSSRYVV